MSELKYSINMYDFSIDIQEFYEAILLDDTKDANSKALAVLKIADKWLENAPLPGQEYPTNKNGLMIQTAGNGSFGAGSPMGLNKNKSPSFHSNMSVDANGQVVVNSPGSGNIELLNDEEALQKAYKDHWVYEKIVLERVRLIY